VRLISKQLTLDGVPTPSLPNVHGTDGHILEWDRTIIETQLLKESCLVEAFY
jgi:ribonucleoside-triphosphate reductase